MLSNSPDFPMMPVVPTSIPMSVRQWFARRKSKQVQDTWPIMPGSERSPEGWPGWPEGRQFAFVLTHDVEGPEGLQKVRPLAEMEMSLGFRSSFNFIPERHNGVTRELREWLIQNGFEIGVRDIDHGRNADLNRQGYAERTVKLNEYLKEWNAVGFRSGLLRHDLDWLHDLDVRYDCSTFDTDPFATQPHGVATLFPFWVPRPEAKGNRQNSDTASHPGFVELPTTIPQDATLFLLGRETFIEVWKNKLEWIVKNRGMVLLNTHPHYMALNESKLKAREYPLSFYEQFLRYIRSNFSGAFWHARPKEVANFVTKVKPPLRSRPKRICMLCYSHYQTDARVTRYAEALADRGDQVDVVALQRSPDHPVREKVGNVNLVRLQSRYGKNEKSRLSFLLPVLRFLLVSSVWIARQHARRRYDALHIHNVPDFLVFAALWPRLTGAKVILDIHDIVPEFYASKFGARSQSKTISLLKRIEHWSAKCAHRVIIANHLWLETYSTRTGANGKCSVFINNVDAQIFRARPRTRNDNKQIILFPGGLQWHQGLDIALRAFQKISAKVPNAEFHIYGEGNMKESLQTLAANLGLTNKVRFFSPLPVRQIAEIMANADLGIVPKRADSFGNEAYSTKIMEFMSLGIPVVISSTKVDRFYFNESVARFFESGNETDLADAAVEVLSNPEVRQAMVTRASAYAACHSWESRRGDYLKFVDDLCANR